MAILRILTTEVGAGEQVLPLGEAVVRLGRAEDNDLVLLEQSASRHHAQIEPVEGGYEIIDLGSGGGLTVAGVRAARRRLRDGDEVVIGGTRIRFVEHPGSERTVLPAAEAPPSSLATEAGGDDPGAAQTLEAARLPGEQTDLGDADTMPPDAAPNVPRSATMQASHEPAPPPVSPAPSVPLPQGTIQAPHQPATPPPPVAQPRIEPVQPPDPKHPSSNESFVFEGGPSSPSNYSLDGPGGQQPGASGGYSLEGGRGGGGLAMDTVPPTSLRRGPGAGAYLLLALVGAAASFGILTALQGVPW